MVPLLSPSVIAVFLREREKESKRGGSKEKALEVKQVLYIKMPGASQKCTIMGSD